MNEMAHLLAAEQKFQYFPIPLNVSVRIELVVVDEVLRRFRIFLFESCCLLGFLQSIVGSFSYVDYQCFWLC